MKKMQTNERKKGNIGKEQTKTATMRKKRK